MYKLLLLIIYKLSTSSVSQEFFKGAKFRTSGSTLVFFLATHGKRLKNSKIWFFYQENQNIFKAKVTTTLYGVAVDTYLVQPYMGSEHTRIV